MDQHTAMNDAGNFLIETCDETVSLDLKQQLLLLNGRWRELFLKVKQVTNPKNICVCVCVCIGYMFLLILSQDAKNKLGFKKGFIFILNVWYYLT